MCKEHAKNSDMLKENGIEANKDYRKENKLISVTTEKGTMLFTDVDYDQEGWITGRQFGSTMTSVKIDGIVSMQIVNVEDVI